MLKRLRGIIKNQLGLTLIELMIALTITGIICGTVTMITFQVFDGEARSNNHMDALSRVQNAGRELSRDAGMAQTVSWTNGDFPLTLTWTKWGTGAGDDELHQVVYSIENNELKRVHYINGALSESYVFEYVNCERDPDGSALTFILTATVGVSSQQVSETRVYSITPRPSI
jgi:prepilin-type N-terminal cleavage/methylation domain-containing protein